MRGNEGSENQRGKSKSLEINVEFGFLRTDEGEISLG